MLECDELWSFIGSKEEGASAGSGSPCAGAPARSSPPCKGDRSEGKVRAGCAFLCRRITSAAPRAATSGFPYEAAFPRRTHRLCAKASGEISHAERFFCTARQRISRLVRKTLSFSRSFAMHELWLRLFLTHYNLQLQR